MKGSRRYIIALLLTVVYAAIVLSPLAPLALSSAHVAHAVTGECVGDCDVCGCSPEARSSHACCCWQKKLRQERERTQCAGAGCGHEHGPALAEFCRKKQEPAPVADCCGKKERDDARPVLACGCPCGSSKMAGLWGAQKHEQVPWRFAGLIPAFCGDSRFHPVIDRPADRRGDPPDPPPKLSFLS